VLGADRRARPPPTTRRTPFLTFRPDLIFVQNRHLHKNCPNSPYFCAKPLGKAYPHISTQLSTPCGENLHPQSLARASAVMHTRGWLSTIYACLSTTHRILKIGVAALNFPARSLSRRNFPVSVSYPHLVWMKVDICGQSEVGKRRRETVLESLALP
jgi:hypothetical protein